ncbi:NAD/NADP transhydrogenase beta subunit [Vibrio alfacsensis]|uniref:NAD/NADP transhydrogenase beta subunit n=1 Tax=Vibrio alfacsensis TaxID=1074311 RepID=UPI004069393A
MAITFESHVCSIGGEKFSIDQVAKATLSLPESAEMHVELECFETRLSHLIRTQAQHIQNCGITGQVCVLLPVISCQSTLKKVTSIILSALKGISSKQVIVYPYGNSSFLMAFSRIERLTIETGFVWVIGINVRESLKSEVDIYDSLVVARCVVSDEGVCASAQSIDLELACQNTAVENVAKQLGKACNQPITDVALSIDSGEPKWLHSIQFLSPWIVAETRYSLIDAVTGPLGACSGVLKMLSICAQQNEQRIDNFQVIQMDLEPKGYAVGTLFSWCSE